MYAWRGREEGGSGDDGDDKDDEDGEDYNLEGGELLIIMIAMPVTTMPMIMVRTGMFSMLIFMHGL